MLHAASGADTGGWTVTNDATAASGDRLQNPNAGCGEAGHGARRRRAGLRGDVRRRGRQGLSALAARQGAHDSYSNDSVFVQFDGSVDARDARMWRIGTTDATTVVLEDCSGCGLQGWGWADNAYGAGALGPLVCFAVSGPQRMRIQMREDGLGIDQVVLSAQTYLTTLAGRRQE